MNDRVEQLFHEAMDRAPGERLAYLRLACGGDESLMAEVHSLLGYGEEASAVFDNAIGRLAATMTPMEGSRVGAYRLLRPVGEGGMGVVYLGVRDDGEFENQVAIKFVQGGEEIMARFRQERQILARLAHPNIARLLDGGITEDGHPFMVMDYFPGKSITEYCQARNLTATERLVLFRKACDAVEHAHRSLVIHRDVKPSNILVNEHGELKLLDFGIAKLLEPGPDSAALTMTGMRFFTPDYASPEQIRGDAVTTATDVYSLGAVLYELLTGRRPHALSKYTPAEITQVVCINPVETPQLGAELDAIVLMALRKEPERRYASVAQFSDDIGRYLENRPVLARPDTRGYRIRKFVQRHRLPVAAAGVAVLSLIGGAGAAVWQAGIARRQAAEAQHRFEQVRKLARTVLFDLDPKIRNLTGATDARELLVKTGTEYLDSLSAAARSDLSLRRELALAYEQVGDVQGAPGRPNLGQRKQAVESYRKAVELWEQIPDLSIDDKRALADAYLKLFEIGGMAGALGKGAKLAEDIVAARPGAASYAVAARAFRLLGVSGRNQSNREEALKNLEIALDYAGRWQQASPKTSGPLEMQAAVYTTIADVQLQAGHPKEVVEATDHVIDIRSSLVAANPGNAIHSRALFRAYMLRAAALGDPEYRNLGRTAEARQSMGKALEIATGQHKADPRSALARGDLADAEATLANLVLQSEPRQARAHYESALAHYGTLLQAAPNNLPYKSNAAQIHVSLGDLLHKLREEPAALGHLHQALAMQREIAAALPGQPGLRFNTMYTLDHIASFHMDLGQREQAAKVLEEARKIAESVPGDASRKPRLDAMSRVFAALGRLHTMNRSTEARDWYRKSLACLDEMEKVEAGRPHVRERRRAVELAMASAK